MNRKIDEIFCWVALGEVEEVPCGRHPETPNFLLPLIINDRERALALAQKAVCASHITGRKLELRRFSGPYEVIKTIPDFS